MKSIVTIEVNRPRREVAMLLADPGNMTEWMRDLERYEHIGGDRGAVGARFRMVPKPGTRQLAFVSTVTTMHLPERLSLRLEASTVDVLVNTTFTALSPDRTRMVSEEKFIFHGLFRKLLSLFARSDIRKHHREHIEAFKRFAENAW